jgi:TRAP-type C4-dicarboxylate transport system permease small subunit
MDKFTGILKTLKRLTEKFIEEISGLLLLGMLIITFVGVLSRYIVNRPIIYTEELTRVFLIYMVLLGSIINARRHETLRVSFFVKLLPVKTQKFLDLIINAILLLVMFSLIYYGIVLTIMAQKQYTTVLKIPWPYIYAVVPITAAGVVGYVIRNLIDLLKNRKSVEDGG